jgi:hypothetical protein
MTSRKKKDITVQPAAGHTGERGHTLTDDSLDQIRGGVARPVSEADRIAEDRQIEQYIIDNAYPRSPSDLPGFQK